jgi:hypothetical protein
MSTNEEHDRYMQQRYGLLPGQYRWMLANQAGRCFICGGFPSPSRRLALDHDHMTGEPRGLLCDGCNTFLARAETYLGRRQPYGIWPLPPSDGLWVNGELWTWRPSRDLYDRDMTYNPWQPRWQLEAPWRLQPEPKHLAEQRRERERRWQERSLLGGVFDGEGPTPNPRIRRLEP